MDHATGGDLPDVARCIRMPRFLAIEDLPADADDARVRTLLERLSLESDHEGVHPLESIVSLARSSAFTLFDATDEAAVARVHARAGLSEPEVFPADRVFTELLTEDHRSRTRSD